MIKNFLTHHKLLFGIILIAILLRFIGTNPGYPPIHTDEGISHSQGIAMILERTLDPKHGYGASYNYPIIVPLVNALFYLLVFIPLYSFGFMIFHIDDILKIISNSNWDLLSGIFDKNILGIGRINVVFWGRYVTALFGVGVVIMTYLVSKQLFKSIYIGLLSALFIAINYRQVLNSHFGLPDIYNAFFLLLALYWIIRLWKKQTLGVYFFTGISIALYFSTKFQFFAIIPLFVVLIFISLQKRTWIKRMKFFLNFKIFFMFIVLISTAFILNYFHLLHLKETLDQVGYSALKYRNGRFQIDLFPLMYLYHIGVGPIMSMFVIGGIFLGLISRFRQIIILLAVILPFMIFMCYYTGGGFYTRNFVTITPLLLICAAYFIWWIVDYFKERIHKFAIIVIISLIAVLSFESLKNSIIVPIEYSKPWNYKIVQKWVGQNIPEGSFVVAHPTTSFFGKKINLMSANNPDDYFLQEMQEKNAQWAVINLEHINGEFLWWMTQDLSTQFTLGWFPSKLLLNSSLAKMTLELKDYIVFESLNPWQGPDNNFLVIKIPLQLTFESGKLIYNNDLGAVNNFFSPKIEVQGGMVYKIRGMMHSSTALGKDNKDGFLEADFFSEDGKIVKLALSSRLEGQRGWTEKEFVVQSPSDTKYMQLSFFKERSDYISIWLKDIEVWESTENFAINTDKMYIKSNYKPEEHLFLTSNGGM